MNIYNNFLQKVTGTCLLLNLREIIVIGTSDFEYSQEEDVSKGTEVETLDGCPYSYDFGRLAYKYKRPRICHTLLPHKLPGLVHQASKKPFTISVEPTDQDDTFHRVILSVAEGFNETIAGGILKVQRLKANGRTSVELPAGHLEGEPPWEPGYCCSKSKFNTLIVFFQKNVKLREKRVKARWYPMNFGEGKIILTANVFAEHGAYWRIRSMEIKVPIVIGTSTDARPK